MHGISFPNEGFKRTPLSVALSVVTYSMLIHRCLHQGLACTIVTLAGRVIEVEKGEGTPSNHEKVH
jgi:hypothetical protein